VKADVPIRGSKIARSQAAITEQYHFGIGESDASQDQSKKLELSPFAVDVHVGMYRVIWTG
jgi:hypothetical protein